MSLSFKFSLSDTFTHTSILQLQPPHRSTSTYRSKHARILDMEQTESTEWPTLRSQKLPHGADEGSRFVVEVTAAKTHGKLHYSCLFLKRACMTLSQINFIQWPTPPGGSIKAPPWSAHFCPMLRQSKPGLCHFCLASLLPYISLIHPHPHPHHHALISTTHG